MENCQQWYNLSFTPNVESTLKHYEKLVKQNSEQLFACNIIKSYIDSKDKSTQMFVSGEAGTGKSNILHYIREYIKHKKKEEELVVEAYTGMAASNIGGELILSRMNMTPSSDKRRNSRRNGKIDLSDKVKEKLTKMNKLVRCILIDEAWQLGKYL